VTGWLRRLLDRPLADGERHTAFVAALMVLLVAAGVLVLFAPPPSETPAPRWTATVPAPVSVPDGTGQRRAAAVRRAGRAFLADYLAYVHGRLRRPRIAFAGNELRRRLAHHRLRVPPAAARRHPPRIVRLTDHATAADGRWLVTATVTDGRLVRYPVQLVVALQAGQLVVVQVGEER
jgi:hypothetical protein